MNCVDRLKLRTQFYILRHGHSLRQLFWECTLRCNINCLHCGSDCRALPEENDMPFTQFEPTLDKIAQTYDPNKIIIITTGGEPLVRRDIVQCGAKIRQKGFMWGMVSNGMLLTDQKFQELRQAGLNLLSISLDGLEENHNWLRNNPLSYQNAIRAIKLLANEPKILGDVITCVNEHNFNDLPQLKNLLISLNVKYWRVTTIIPMGRAKDNKDLQLTPQHLRQLLDFIVLTRQEGKISLSFGCEGYLGQYEDKVRDLPFFCQAGINTASILADGSISGCLSIRSEYNQGNILKGDDFINIWESAFSKYRNHKWMKTAECHHCKAWDICQGGAFHLRESDGSMMRCNYLEITK